MIFFTNETLLEIINSLKTQLMTKKAQESIAFTVLNPDHYNSIYSGTKISYNGVEYLYHSYKNWVDLAHILECKMLTPTLFNSKIQSRLITLRFQKLGLDSFHSINSDVEEKYGKESIFGTIYKNEEASFLHYFTQSLQNASLNSRKKILNLGVNSGDEFELISHLTQEFSSHQLLGIDYCQSAIQNARAKFKEHKNVNFILHDINKLPSLKLEKFDLIISIGTLQSSSLSFNKLLMSIVQNSLKRDGAIILGFPNCRWRDGEMLYGARVKNYAYSEMGLLFKDVIFSKKYLQQKQFRVTITGKDYIFLTATSIKKSL